VLEAQHLARQVTVNPFEKPAWILAGAQALALALALAFHHTAAGNYIFYLVAAITIPGLLMGQLALGRYCQLDFSPLWVVPFAVIPIGGLVPVFVFAAWPLLRGTFGGNPPGLSGPVGIPLGLLVAMGAIAAQAAFFLFVL
jgi:hypothetical protein